MKLNIFQKLKAWSVLFLLVTLGVSQANAQKKSATDSVVVSNSNGTARDWGRGFEFKPLEPILVTDLGIFPLAIDTFPVILWDITNQVALANMDLIATQNTGYEYFPLPSAVYLSPGVNYAITMYSEDQGYHWGHSTQIDPKLEYVSMKYCGNCAANQDFPTQSLLGAHYGLPDFLFVPAALKLKGNNNTIPFSSTVTQVSNNTSYDSVIINTTKNHEFLVQNHSVFIEDTVVLSGIPKVTITGANASDFSLTLQPAVDTLFGGDSIAFNILFTPSDTGIREATVNINYIDSTQGNAVYTYAISGIGYVPEFSLSINIDSNVTCFGLSNGGVTVNISSATGPYSYLWSNNSTDSSLSNIPSGTYSLRVINSLQDTLIDSVTVTQPTLLIATTVVDSNITCNGTSDGGATASATGGTLPYTYSWSNSATTASITGVVAGTYSVTITDQNGCTDSTSTSVSEPAVLVATTVIDSNTVDGNPNGGATGSATGGTMPYTYSWSNAATTASITGVVAGTFSVTVSDNKGCTDSSSAVIINTISLTASVAVDSNVSCNTGNDGGLTVTATGTNTPFSYTWSNGATTASITGLAAGTYTITVMDAGSTTTTESATITEPTNLVSATVVDSNITCNGFANGGVTASASGGTGAYAYEWSNAANTASITGIMAATYTVTVTDGNGCTSTSSTIVTQPDSIIVTASVDSNATCSGFSNGGAIASATGGTGAYTYLWSNASTMASNTGIMAGTYSVTVTDANGCFNSDTVNVIVQDTVLPVVITQNINAYLDNNGVATAIAADVDNGSSDACGIQSMALNMASFSCSHIGQNTVQLLVTDVNGNIDSAATIVTVIDTISPVLAIQNYTAYLDVSGSVTIDSSLANNGTSDNCLVQTIAISPNNFNCSNVGSNNVTVTATDASANSTMGTVIVTVLDTISPNVYTQNITVYLDATGTASITAADIDNNSVDNCSIQNLALNTTQFDCSQIGLNSVNLSATDANGNTATKTATVTVLDTISPTVITQNYTAYLNPAGFAFIQVTDIENGSFDNCTVQSRTLNQASFTCADTGVNTVILEVTDINGNINSANATVTILDTLPPTINTQNHTVYLDNNGQATISVSDIDNGSLDNCSVLNMSLDITSFDCTMSGSNTVTLTVNDVNGNTGAETAIVMVLDTISPTVITKDVTVYLDASGMVIITPADIDNGSTDNCTIQSQSLDISSFSCVDLGNNNVILTVTDASGNNQFEKASVTVLDTITPAITCPSNFSDCGPEITIPAIITTDNCSTTLTLVSGIESNQTFPVGLTTNTYELVDISGNSTTCSVDITRYPQPIVSVREDTTVYYEQSVVLYSTSEFVVEWDWTPGTYLNDASAQEPICTPQFTTEYTLVGKSADGCYSDPKYITVEVYSDGEVLVPNTFSPNGDGFNDYFEIPGISFHPDMRMTVFNRNGEVLFQETGYENNWDGTANGKTLPVATYYFILDQGNGQEPIKGDITIIK